LILSEKLSRIQSEVAAIVLEMRLHRLSRRWTQIDLADRAGINRTTVADYETGRHHPNLYYLDRIAQGLGYQIGIYLEEADKSGDVQDGHGSVDTGS
jgi:transcriptional regulator with XRE-family HTH domain